MTTDIVTINPKRIFTIEEANSILPLIYRITDNAQLTVKKMMNQLESFKSSGSLQAADIEKKIEFEILKWQKKIEKIGARPKGLWLADFDFGKGYYCWKYPEIKLNHWHHYDEGFSGRKIINYENSNSSDQLNSW